MLYGYKFHKKLFINNSSLSWSKECYDLFLNTLDNTL